MPERSTPTIEIMAEVIKETEDSFILSDDGENKQWFPKSLLDHSPDPQVGDTICFEMPEWLAIEKGFV